MPPWMDLQGILLSEVRQRKTHTAQSHTGLRTPDSEKRRAGGGGEGKKWVKVVKWYKLPGRSSGDGMYNMVTL